MSDGWFGFFVGMMITGIILNLVWLAVLGRL